MLLRRVASRSMTRQCPMTMMAPFPRVIRACATTPDSNGVRSRPSYSVPNCNYTLPHPVWTREYAENVKITAQPKANFGDYVASFVVRCLRFNFDYVSGYHFGVMSERKWLVRMVFLETVAGCPGFMAAMVRHLTSLRRMQRDNGWIHTLLEEAENERMHLLTFIGMYKPNALFRFGVLMTQGLVSNALMFSYLLAPRVVHRFVGYLEEEAVKTYTHCLKDIDDPKGTLHSWSTQLAPEIATQYWQLPPGATMRDVILQVRADEAHHRDVNHTFANLLEKDPNSKNPFAAGE